MYKKLLVPLDGSDLAEVALPHAEEIAKGCQAAEVHLISVTEAIRAQIANTGALERKARDEDVRPPQQNLDVQPGLVGGPLYPSQNYRAFGQPVLVGRMARTAEEYLDKAGEGLAKKGVQIKTAVLAGDPAAEILRYAETEKADLIIMGSRGHSGFNRWDMGNIAEKVIRAAKIPVLLVKPVESFKETKGKRHGDAAQI